MGNSRHRNGVNFKEMYGNFNNYINNESNKSMNANININNGNECHVKIPKTNIVKKKKS